MFDEERGVGGAWRRGVLRMAGLLRSTCAQVFPPEGELVSRRRSRTLAGARRCDEWEQRSLCRHACDNERPREALIGDLLSRAGAASPAARAARRTLGCRWPEGAPDTLFRCACDRDFRRRRRRPSQHSRRGGTPGALAACNAYAARCCAAVSFYARAPLDLHRIDGAGEMPHFPRIADKQAGKPWTGPTPRR